MLARSFSWDPDAHYPIAPPARVFDRLYTKFKILSCTQKNKTAACDAVGKYPERVVSISFSVIAASFCFALISSERTFELDKILMAVSSSRMLPSDARTSRILSSISFSLFLFYHWFSNFCFSNQPSQIDPNSQSEIELLFENLPELLQQSIYF